MNKAQKELVHQLYDFPVSFGYKLGYNLLTPDLHNTWIRNMLLAKDDYTLQAHRDSYKTTCLIIALTLLIILRPDIQTLLLRKDESSTKEVVRAVKNNLKTPISKNIIYNLYGVWLNFSKDSATELHTNLVPTDHGVKESQLVTTGIRSFGLTGSHAKRIFTDDIVTLKDRVSKAERENTKMVYQELQNIRMKDDSVIVNTGTPWHKEDCFSIMPAAEKHNCYETGLLSDKQLREKKSKMTASLFSANYELKHISSEDAMFKNPAYGEYPFYDGFAHVDGAFGGDNTTAYTALCKKDGNWYGYGKVWPKHIQDCYKEIISLNQKYKIGSLYLETNADKGYSAADLSKLWPSVKRYHERMNKHYKISTYLKGEWADIIWAHETDPEYMNQITDYQEGLEPDDAPDSVASLIRAVDKTNTKIRTW